jgi:hypothetical protein
MHWYYFVSYFFGGAFLVNALPHLGTGVAGRPFQSPFAKPPGKGLSSSTVNVLWGFLNLVIAYLLILCVGNFSIRDIPRVITLGAGMLLMSLNHAWGFGRFHGGNLKS